MEESAQDTKRTDENCVEVLSEQEEKLFAKYGGLRPKHKLIMKDHKFFDSADWAQSLQKGDKEQAKVTKLQPKLHPSPPHPKKHTMLDDSNDR